MKDSKRHIVLLTLICIIEIFTVLAFPSLFPAVFTFSCIASITVFIYYLTKKNYAVSVLFTFMILFSAVNPYRLYMKGENEADSLTRSFDGAETECIAVVTESKHYSSYSVLFADILYLDGERLEKAYSARLGSYTAGSVNDGDIIKFRGKMQSVSSVESELFDTKSYLRSKNVFIDFPSAEIISSAYGGKMSLTSQLRQYTKNVIYKYVPKDFDFDTASVAYAMLAGDQNYIEDGIKDSFRKSGLTHVLCVSGMHLTILMGAFYALFSLFTMHKNVKCTLVILLCFMYCIFTGFSLSTLRAAIMCLITFTALMTGRKTDGYISLFFAILVICTLFPYAVLDISLILSFCSCLGILSFIDIRPIFRKKGRLSSLLSALTDLLFANLGAVVFTLPVSCHSFGGFSCVSVVTTLFVSFFCELLLIASLILVFLSPAGSIGFMKPGIAAAGALCDRLCDIIISIADAFSRLRYAYIDTLDSKSIIFICIFAAILIILTLFIALGMKRARFFVTLFTALICTVFCFSMLFSAIIDDGSYRVSYFRQNENDRILSIKLARSGYLLVNADSVINANSDKVPFDIYNRHNYLLLIPDSKVNPVLLADSIKIFGERYGTEKIFVPKTSDGTSLAAALSKEGIICHHMPERSDFGKVSIDFHSGDCQKLSITDGKEATTVVFADSYSEKYFDEGADICAFFTRRTKNQFKPKTDTMPDCRVFFTRMGKDDEISGIQNTYKTRSFTIKE